MNAWQVSVLPPATPQSMIDPSRFPGMRDLEQQKWGAPPMRRATTSCPRGSARASAVRADGSGQAPCGSVRRPDHRGHPPLPGDIDAIRVLCTLDDATVTAVLRWVADGPRI